MRAWNERRQLPRRTHVLAIQPISPRASRTLHRLRLTLEAVIDLRDPTVLAELDVDPASLVGDDYSLCQAIGGAAAFLEIDGLIVASARAPGANVVVLFSSSGRIPSCGGHLQRGVLMCLGAGAGAQSPKMLYGWRFRAAIAGRLRRIESGVGPSPGVPTCLSRRSTDLVNERAGARILLTAGSADFPEGGTGAVMLQLCCPSP